MGVPTSEVGYTSAMPRREDHEVHKDMWGHWGKKNYVMLAWWWSNGRNMLPISLIIKNIVVFDRKYIFINFYQSREQGNERWVKRDQLDVTCFIISLYNAQHVSDVKTSILRSLQLICWVISWVLLIWFDVCWCYVVVWLWWCGIRMQAEAHKSQAPEDVLTFETCWALNKEIIKQMTSNWSLSLLNYEKIIWLICLVHEPISNYTIQIVLVLRRFDL